MNNLNIFKICSFSVFISFLYSKIMAEPVIVVHGGAGDIPDSRNQSKFDGMLAAVRKAYASFNKSSSIMDACQVAVECMEDDVAFNAGRGSVLNLSGEIEMEALIMEGKHMKAGINDNNVSNYKGVKFIHFYRKCYWCKKYCTSNCFSQKSDGKHTSRMSDGVRC